MGAILVLAMAMRAEAAPSERADERREAIIVVLGEEVGDPAAVALELARSHGGEVGFVYEDALNGFSGSFPSGRLEGLRRDPRVDLVELDQPVEAFVQSTPNGVLRVYADANAAIGIDGLDDARVDVDVAIIDTGIDLDHPDLNVVGSVSCFYTVGLARVCGAGGDDDNSHGTHVAGTVAALDNDVGVVGLAPGARLWAVKVLDSKGSGAMSGVVAGIDWVTATRTDGDPTNDIAVANMSLGCRCTSASLDLALTNSVARGVAYAVSAGNSDADADAFSPARHPDVLTVSALADFDGAPGGLAAATCRADEDDTLANFSNFGAAVDVIAPGVCVVSTVPGGYGTKSGTSMSAPHATGALALLASAATSTNRAQVRALYDTLKDEGSSDWDASDDGDAVQEPLLDVGDPAAFAPVLVPTGGPPPAPDGTLVVVAEEYRRSGGKSRDRNLDVTIRVAAADGVTGVAAATVEVDVQRRNTDGVSWSTVRTGSGATDGSGVVTLSFRDVGAGCFRADITDVRKDGSLWNGSDPEATSCP